MADERYTTTLEFKAIEEGGEEEPMVESKTTWRRLSYTGLVQLEDRVVNGVLGETVKWGKTNTKFKGLQD